MQAGSLPLPDVPVVQLRLHVSPGGRRNELSVAPNGQLTVKVAAPPKEGKANLELLAFLAAKLDLPRSRVRLTSGAASRYKVVEVEGLTAEVVRDRLGA